MAKKKKRADARTRIAECQECGGEFRYRPSPKGGKPRMYCNACGHNSRTRAQWREAQARRRAVAKSKSKASKKRRA